MASDRKRIVAIAYSSHHEPLEVAFDTKKHAEAFALRENARHSTDDTGIEWQVKTLTMHRLAEDVAIDYES